MKTKTKTINVVLMNGGVGDHVSSFTVIDYISKRYPHITQLVWMPDMLLDLAECVIDSERVELNSYSSMKGRYNPERYTKTTEWDKVISPLRMHCMDYAFLKLCDEIPDIEHKNYLRLKKPVDVKRFGLPKRFVVLTTGFTAEVREFRPEYVNEVVSFIRSRGHDVVFLGQTETKTGALYKIKAKFKEEIDFTKGLNLIDKTSLSEAVTIMSRSQGVVGVDNGLLHVAGLTDVPIVGGFTTVKPEHRVAIRKDELGWGYYAVGPGLGLKCVFCQSNTNFLYGHDYTTCLNEEESMKLVCTKLLDAKAFISRLEVFL